MAVIPILQFDVHHNIRTNLYAKKSFLVI